jgi:hypothetical protein
MYVLYYTSMLWCWHLVWILVRTDHPCLGVGCHTRKLCHMSTSKLCYWSISKLCYMSTNKLCYWDTSKLCYMSTSKLCYWSTSKLCYMSTSKLGPPIARSTRDYPTTSSSSCVFIPRSDRPSIPSCRPLTIEAAPPPPRPPLSRTPH